MTDNLRESFSAFIDGEASEIEIHRLLRHFESNDGADQSWVSFQQIRSVVRGDAALSTTQHESLRERIRLSILEEDAFDEAPALSRQPRLSTYARPAAALGVAASLVAAVFIGVNLNQDIGVPSGQPTAGTPSVETASPARSSGPRDVQTVANQQNPAQNSAMDAAGPEGELELRELDDETLRAVRAYLNQHDRAVRMQPDTRTVIFEEPEGQ